MADMKWEQMPIEERIKVWAVYSAFLLKKEGYQISFEQVDAGRTGYRWVTIKYTFGVAEYLH